MIRPGLGRLYAFGFAWMFLVVMPVMVPFLVQGGLTAGQVLQLQGVYGVCVTALEVPTGYLCDRFGRPRTILAGAVLNLLGFTGLAALHGFGPLVGVELVLASGWALVSGADVALIYDLLHDADRLARRRALADYQLAQVLGEASAALLGGLLASRSLQWAAWAGAAASCAPVLIALRLRTPHGPGRRRVAAEDLRHVLGDVLGQVLGDRRRRLVFANMTTWNLSTFFAVWLLQPYWQSRGVGLRWFGLLWAGTLLTVGAAGKLAPLLERRAGPRAVLLILALAPPAAYLGMASGAGAAGIASGFLFYLSRGLNSVHLREAFNHGLPDRLRATCNSVASGTFRCLFSVLGPLAGLVLDRAGIDAALAALGAVFGLLFLGLALPLVRATPAR